MAIGDILCVFVCIIVFVVTIITFIIALLRGFATGQKNRIKVTIPKFGRRGVVKQM
jgi:hypothetical protein